MKVKTTKRKSEIKEDYVNKTLILLSKTYQTESGTSQIVREAILKKFSFNEICSLHALVLTSVEK